MLVGDGGEALSGIFKYRRPLDALAMLSSAVPLVSTEQQEAELARYQRVSCGATAIGSQPGRPWRMRSAFFTGVTCP
jgi:hypothetical protein